MNLKTFISKAIGNIRYVVDTTYAKEAETEDPHSYGLLMEHLWLKNAHRVIMCSVFTFICGALTAIFGEHAPLGMIGSILLMGASVAFLWLMYKAVFDGVPNYKQIKLFSYLYWISMTAGSIMVALAEQLSEQTPYFFLIFLAVIVSVPIVSLYESLFFAGVILISMLYYGISLEKGVLYYIAAAAVTIAYFWLASLIRCCYSSIWLGRRRIETTEDRCIQISRKDALTGLLNKSGLSDKFAEITARPTDKKNMSVILIDIDNFRVFNHLYGYDKSDDCLYRVCNCIKIVSKPYTQLISRFGGDEFVLIFEDTDEVETVKIAEQLRQSVETMAQPFGNGIVTVSIGVSGVSEKVDREEYSELLKEADKQLAIAKASGKNCIGFKDRPFIHEKRRIAGGY